MNARTEVVLQSEKQQHVASSVLQYIDLIIQKTNSTIIYSGYNFAFFSVKSNNTRYVLGTQSVNGVNIRFVKFPPATTNLTAVDILPSNATVLTILPSSLLNVTNTLSAYVFRINKLFISSNKSTVLSTIIALSYSRTLNQSIVVSTIISLSYPDRIIEDLKENVTIQFIINDTTLDKSGIKCVIWRQTPGKSCTNMNVYISYISVQT